MSDLYKKIILAQEAFKSGASKYDLVDQEGYRLSLILDGWVTVEIDLNGVLIYPCDEFSYHLDAEAIEHRINIALCRMNESLSYLMLDLI